MYVCVSCPYVGGHKVCGVTSPGIKQHGVDLIKVQTIERNAKYNPIPSRRNISQ
jgi:hypothetical protein